MSNRTNTAGEYERDSFSMRRMTSTQAWALTLLAVAVIAMGLGYVFG